MFFVVAGEALEGLWRAHKKERKGNTHTKKKRKERTYALAARDESMHGVTRDKARRDPACSGLQRRHSRGVISCGVVLAAAL